MRSLSLGSAELAGLAEEVLNRGGTIAFRARGYSMLPTFRDGDLLSAAPLGNEPIAEGDLLLYRDPRGRAVVHRVAAPTSGHQLTMICDARPGCTYEVSARSILGRIRCATRKGRSLPLGPAGMLRPGWLLLRARRSVRRAISARVQWLTAFRPLRRLYALLLRRRLAIETMPAQGDPKELSWVPLKALLGSLEAGSAQLVRFPAATPLGRYQWLFSVFVRPVFRGAGIGRMLSEEALRIADASSADTALMVAPDNGRALSLYRSLGFAKLSLEGASGDLLPHVGRGRVVMVRRREVDAE